MLPGKPPQTKLVFDGVIFGNIVINIVIDVVMSSRGSISSSVSYFVLADYK